jgi:hypothetical protein
MKIFDFKSHSILSTTSWIFTLLFLALNIIVFTKYGKNIILNKLLRIIYLLNIVLIALSLIVLTTIAFITNDNNIFKVFF